MHQDDTHALFIKRKLKRMCFFVGKFFCEYRYVVEEIVKCSLQLHPVWFHMKVK